MRINMKLHIRQHMNFYKKINHCSYAIRLSYLAVMMLSLLAPMVHVQAAVITYSYDTCTKGAGRLCSVNDASGTSSFGYNIMGQIVQSAKTVDSTAYTTSTTYDNAGRVATISYPQNSGTITYDYDGPALKRVKQGTTVFVEYANFNEAGQAITARYNNNRVVTTYSYAVPGVSCPRSNNYSLCALTTQQGSTILQQLSYSYDNAGNITAINDTISGNQSFQYDDLDRLTQANGPYTTQIYTYNNIGNMLSNTRTGTYSYNSSRPHAVTNTSIGNNTYTYDANGNMTNVSGSVARTITYNSENRPLQAQFNGQTTTLVYDGNGGRVKKTVNETTTLYIGQLYECTSGVCKRYIFAGGQRIAEVPVSNPSDVSYYHPDHLGSSSVVTYNNQPNDTQRVTYYPYGETLTNSYPSGKDVNYKYTGQMLDDSTGLYFYGARYYDARLARFISPDSIIQAPGNPQAFNRYTYVRNNPIIYTDPSGNISIRAIAMIAVPMALMGNISMGIIGSAAIGATVGASITAATGGDVKQGAISGAINGAIMIPAGLAAPFTGPFAPALLAAAGATAGAASAAATGGDIGKGALVGGLSGAVSGGVGLGLENSSIYIQGGTQIATASIIGGAASKYMGGSFSDGAIAGAMGATMAFAAYALIQSKLASNDYEGTKPSAKTIRDLKTQNSDDVMPDAIRVSDNGQLIPSEYNYYDHDKAKYVLRFETKGIPDDTVLAFRVEQYSDGWTRWYDTAYGTVKKGWVELWFERSKLSTNPPPGSPVEAYRATPLFPYGNSGSSTVCAQGFDCARLR